MVHIFLETCACA